MVDNSGYSGPAAQDPSISSRISAAQNVVVNPTVFTTISAATNAIYSDPYYNSTTATVTRQTVVLVAPGTYREMVTPDFSGTLSCPVIYEGVPDASGNMPMISAATVFANNSWTLQSVLGDVNVAGESLYRATIPYNYDDYGNNYAQRIGDVAANDQTFIQQSNPAFLSPGQMAFNYGSTEFLDMYGMTADSSQSAVPSLGQTATAVSADSNGYLDFSSFGGTTNQVVWVDTWVWVPQPTSGGYLFNGQVVGADDYTYGPFRAAPNSDESVDDQANPYRLWINGTAVGQIYNSATDYQQNLSHPDARAYNPFSSASNPIEDTWDSLTLNVGWNHLVFQFDTSVAVRYGPAGTDTAQGTNGYYSEEPYWEQALDFKFTVDGNAYTNGIICQAAAPTGSELTTGPTGTATDYISAWDVLGKIAVNPATDADNGVYVRLTPSQSANLNPNSVMTELDNRDTVFTTNCNDDTGNYIQVRGFNTRFGAIGALGIGDLVEGNYLRDAGVGINNDPCSAQQSLSYTFTTGNNGLAISGSNLAAGDVITFTGSYIPSPLLEYHAYFIGGYSGGLWQLFASAADAQAGTNAIALSGTGGSGTLTISRGGTADPPAIDLNNWMVNITWLSSMDFSNGSYIDGVNENLQNENGTEVLDVPGHQQLIFEYNQVVNYNPLGFWFNWDTAGIKSGNVVNSVFCYNVFSGGAGLGVWLDTANFDNRFDGNLFVNIHGASAINIEASPGTTSLPTTSSSRPLATPAGTSAPGTTTENGQSTTHWIRARGITLRSA